MHCGLYTVRSLIDVKTLYQYFKNIYSYNPFEEISQPEVSGEFWHRTIEHYLTKYFYLAVTLEQSKQFYLV